MSFQRQCPECKRKLSIPSKYQFETISCPTCKAVILPDSEIGSPDADKSKIDFEPWFVRTPDRTLGPYRIDQLHDMAHRALINRQTLVGRSASGPWQQAADIEELFPFQPGQTASNGESTEMPAALSRVNFPGSRNFLATAIGKLAGHGMSDVLRPVKIAVLSMILVATVYAMLKVPLAGLQACYSNWTQEHGSEVRTKRLEQQNILFKSHAEKMRNPNLSQADRIRLMEEHSMDVVRLFQQGDRQNPWYWSTVIVGRITHFVWLTYWIACFGLVAALIVCRNRMDELIMNRYWLAITIAVPVGFFELMRQGLSAFDYNPPSVRALLGIMEKFADSTVFSYAVLLALFLTSLALFRANPAFSRIRLLSYVGMGCWGAYLVTATVVPMMILTRFGVGPVGEALAASGAVILWAIANVLTGLAFLFGIASTAGDAPPVIVTDRERVSGAF